MSTLVTGDLHLTDNPRDEYRHKFVRDTLPGIVEQNSPDELVILGDLTQEKDRHSARLVNSIVEYLATIARYVPIYIDKGNHDYTRPDTPFFKFLSEIPNVHWINEVTEVDLSIGPTLFLPHTYDWQRDWEGIDFWSYRITFAHNTFAGTRGDNGHKLEGIPLPTIDGTHVVSGDIHTPQRVGESVEYVGAPYTMNFGDTFNPRLLMVTDRDLISLLAPGAQKRLIDVTAGGGAGGSPPYPGDVVKIRVALGEEDEKHWPEIREDWRAWATDKKLVLNAIVPVIERRSAGVDRRPAAHTQDVETVIGDYAASRNLTKGQRAAGIWLSRKAI